jgi:hypothetical protein
MSVVSISSAIHHQEQQQHINRFPHDQNVDSVEILDPISRQQLRQELLRGLGESFSGDPQRFWCWHQQISTRLLEAEAGSLDSMYILQANTSGRPKKVIDEALAAGIGSPRENLASVWKTLRRRFGANELVAESLLSKLEALPPARGASQVSQMEDILGICKHILFNMGHCHELQFMELQRGKKLVWEKFPQSFVSKWQRECFLHEEKTSSMPPFASLVSFIESFIKQLSVPGFCDQAQISSRIKPCKALLSQAHPPQSEVRCLYHDSAGHSILECVSFSRLSYHERMQYASDRRLCFACLGEHRISECPRNVKCGKCEKQHSTLMHKDSAQGREGGYPRPKNERSWDGGIKHKRDNYGHAPTKQPYRPANNPTNNCIGVCGDARESRVCSKTVLIDVKIANSDKRLRCLCIIDEQSNSSFCDPKVPAFFTLNTSAHAYTLTTMSGYRTSTKAKLWKVFR